MPAAVAAAGPLVLPSGPLTADDLGALAYEFGCWWGAGFTGPVPPRLIELVAAFIVRQGAAPQS